MGVYCITAFAKDGTRVLEELFEARTEAEARKAAVLLLEEKGIVETYRCTSSNGKLILFHS